MTNYYTTVSASEDFWERVISEKIESDFPITFIGEGAGFTIISKYGPAIWDMIKLSNEYPYERFNVIVTTDNKYQDVIEYYECQSGATFFNHLEPLYHFNLSKEVEDNIGSNTIDDFKKEITDTLNRINDYVPSYKQVIGCQNPNYEMVTNIQFEYGHQDITLFARVICKTYIQIDIKSDSQKGGPDY